MLHNVPGNKKGERENHLRVYKIPYRKVLYNKLEYSDRMVNDPKEREDSDRLNNCGDGDNYMRESPSARERKRVPGEYED